MYNSVILAHNTHRGGCMSVNSKRKLSAIVYYTLAGLALIMAGFFTYCLIVKDVVMWAKVIYFIWIGFVVGVIIFDIIGTSTGEGKMISGLIIYVLSILSVVMAGILYFINVGPVGLATEFFDLFISIAFVSLITSGFLIATWCVGESLVEHVTADREIGRNN